MWLVVRTDGWGLGLEGGWSAGRKVKRQIDGSPSADSSGRLKAPHFVTWLLGESLEGNGQWAGGQKIPWKERQREQGEAGHFAFPVGHMPSNLPAGSSQRLHRPLLLVLILKFLLLAKPSQMEFSGLTILMP